MVANSLREATHKQSRFVSTLLKAEHDDMSEWVAGAILRGITMGVIVPNIYSAVVAKKNGKDDNKHQAFI
jgi:hypothetical protein